jgi:hypothetical protein
MEATSLPENTAKPHVRLELDHASDPPGIRSDSRKAKTMAIHGLLDGAAEAITRKLIDEALGGDRIALRLCFERLVPPKRDCAIAFELPPIASAADALNASSSVLAACARGALSPGEAATIMDLIATHVRTLEVADIEARLGALEKERNGEQKSTARAPRFP